MDRRLLELYQAELTHVRGMSQEFRNKQRESADRLGLDEYGCADPYVERLIESFAYLTARVQLQLDKEFPRFTQSLLELVYPGHLAPTPSMLTVQLVPDYGQPLSNGHLVKRGTELRASTSSGNKCDFRTAHNVTLWPVELLDAAYLSVPPRVLGFESRARSAVRLRLRARQPFSDLSLERLALFLPEESETTGRTYEALMSSAVALAVRPAGGATDFKLAHVGTFQAPVVLPLGFSEDESMFLCDDPVLGSPAGAQRFQGYRLLQEYFAFPRRFMFVELQNLQAAARQCPGVNELELLILLEPASPGVAIARSLEGAISQETFKLHCTPAVNLFRKGADPIVLKESVSEHLVVADPARAHAYEVHTVSNVVGRLARGGGDVPFTPLYSLAAGQGSHYTVERRAWRPPANKGKAVDPGGYTGSDVLLSLSDGASGPFRRDLRHLDVALWCTNRALPLQVNRKASKFSCQTDQAVAQVNCLTDPTRPREAPTGGDIAWQLISQLALNHHSLLDEADGGGLPALRRMLEVYALLDQSDHTTRRRIDGLHAVASSRVVRPLAGNPICYGRGIEVLLRCDENAYEGSGAFLFGAVLERFLARYASINGFTETVLHTHSRGEVMRWPMRTGRRPLL